MEAEIVINSWHENQKEDGTCWKIRHGETLVIKINGVQAHTTGTL